MPLGINYEEDLVPRIRDLIDGYSKDSILKEYLQNADDSGATELVVTYDRRNHSSLIDTKFEIAKETSLLLFNNESFNEKDFNAIVKISAQGKISDAAATGRFGQGFSSSFSISDHPSFVSSGKAYWFDVLRKAVSSSDGESIQAWDIKAETNEVLEWLKTFNIEEDKVGTTFRLPLRNPETASQSEISNEIFKYEDFLKWCDEWKNNTSGLLFLRNINKLVLQEINEQGIKTIHLELQTKNANEINEYNKKLQEGFSEGLLNVCKVWKKQVEQLPFFKYKHKFSIKYFNRENNSSSEFEENWLVVNGLFRGENDSLIEQALKVLSISPNPRKVLPWAGVAISLDQRGYVNKNSKSNYYTFLPLPIKSKHPIHVHGWFDLNPKRTEITFEGSGDDKSILIEWNRLLFKEAVAKAWAHLIDYVKEICDSQTYYSLWPKNHQDEFDEYLLEGFYKEITKLQCFKTKYKEKTSWETPKDKIYYFKDSSNKKTFDAFKEHFSIIHHKPTQDIIYGLSKVDTDLEEITPEFIRDYLSDLSEKLDFPIAIECIPIEMLSKKDWFFSILNYCAEADEDKNYSLLEGLPLELACNNEVTCILEYKLLDSNPKLEIFENDESLFLHPEILKIVKDAEVLPSTWLEPNLKNYLTILNKYIDGYDRKNKKWLASLVGMITKAETSEILEAINTLYEMQIVFQHDEIFAFLKSDSNSPVFISNKELPNIDLLIQIDMQLIHPDYLHIYEPLLKLNEYGLITELNSHSLSEYLLYLPVEQYKFFNNKEIREYLVDLLSQDISWMDKLKRNELGKLKEMPIIATESGGVFAKSSGKKLYLSTGFQPPKHIHNLNGEYEIITVHDDKQYALFKKMGFDEQTLINYLNQIILPFIDNTPSVDDVKNITEWLANNWEELIHDLDEVPKIDLIVKLAKSQIVIDSDNVLDTAESYYHPDFFSDLPEILQDEQYLPFKFEDASTQKKWSDLLVVLGASKKIIPKHIVSTVQSIVLDDDAKKSIGLINYISNHFESFKEMKFGNKNIFSHLSDFAWLPAEKPNSDFLTPAVEYKKLFKPSELILKNDYYIAGGAHYRLSLKVKLGKKDEAGEFTERDIAKSIGLLINLPEKSIFESLRRLQIHSGLKFESKILEFVKAFYKYLGRSDILAEKIPLEVKNEAVFIKGNWLPSSKVFQTPIRLTGIFSWDELIANDGKESDLAKGLKKLGVLEKPTNTYLVEYLSNIPQNQKLNPQQLKDAKAILAQMQNNINDLDDIAELLDATPLLTRSDQLKTSEQLYIKDLPAYDKSEKKNEQLEFCQNQFEKFAKKCGVISLAENITSSIDLANSKESVDPDLSWNKYIRSHFFKSAVLRLIYHEGRISEDEIKPESIDEVLPSNILLMDSLVVKYFINNIWVYDDIVSSTYHDKERSILYTLNQKDDEDICDSVAKFICDKSDLDTDSYSLINRILRHKFDSFDEIHNLLDNKNIKSLPEEIEINENHGLFDPDPIAEEDASSALGIPHNSPPQIEEISPPTKPKSSSPLNIKREEHSSNQHKQSVINSANATISSGIKRKILSINSKKEIVSSNDRKPVYVGTDREIEPHENNDQKNLAIEIGDLGEQYVLKHSNNFLLSKSNKFEILLKNNEGFDFQEVDSSGDIVRYIEVKTLTGRWAEGGVAVTVPQFKFAQEHNNWWLFVVENLNTQNTKVYLLNNPVQKVNRFMFDHSWKQLAEAANIESAEVPENGAKYSLSGVKYEISSIESKGKLYKVILKNIQTGEEMVKKFDPSWERC